MNNYNQLLKRAKTFYKAKKFDEAKDCLLDILNNFQIENILKLKIYLLLSEMMTEVKNFKEVEIYISKYLEIDPDNPKILNFLANNFLKMRNFKNAEIYYLKAINIDKNYEAALVNLALLLENLGRKIEALNHYKKVYEINNNNLAVLFNIIRLDPEFLDENQINHIRKKITDNYNIHNSAANFILSNYEKKKKNYDKEIFFLEKANQFSFLDQEKINKVNLTYWLNFIPSKYDKFTFIKDDGEETGTNSLSPIFVIGLPRSGSTLTEMIISASKNNIIDIGESNLINWVFLNSHDKNFSNNLSIDNILKINIKKIKEKTYNILKNMNISLNNEKTFLLDKSLENFFYVELILKIFPKAKFIHTHRNLYDNIISIYREFLNQISWSHSLDNILQYVDNYLRIISEQKRKYSQSIISVSLEELTSSPKNKSLEIFKFCDLKWDNECISLENKRDFFSQTASRNQIRMGIFKYDENKYKPYYYLLKKYKKKYKWL